MTKSSEPDKNVSSLSEITQVFDQAEKPPTITRKNALAQINDSLKVNEVENNKLTKDINEFYQFWQFPSFKDQSGNEITAENDHQGLAFKNAFIKKLDEDFEKITNYFDSKFLEVSSLGVSSGSSQIFAKDGIKKDGYLCNNLKSFLDSKGQLLSFLRDYSTYIALLAKNIEGATEENKKSQIEKTQQFLEQFPPIVQDEYQCLGGTGSRLSNVLSELQSSSLILLAHESLIRKAVDEFSKKVPPGNQVHIKPMLLYFLGIDQKTISNIDYNYRTPINSINTKELWQFVSSYQEKLNKEVTTIITDAKNAFKNKTQKQREYSENPNAKDYNDLAQSLTENYGIKIEGLDLLDQENFTWKESADFEKLIEAKAREQTQDSRSKLHIKEYTETPAASGAVGNVSNIDNDYFITSPLSSSTDITDPKTIATIVKLAKDQDADKRQVAFSALRILGEDLRDKDENILKFLSILQEICMKQDTEGKEFEVGYKKALGIEITQNQSGTIEKSIVSEENKEVKYLLTRIDDRCDLILRDSIYHIGPVTDENSTQKSKKDLLLFHSALLRGDNKKVSELLESDKGNNNSKHLINQKNKFNEDAIHIAAKQDNGEVITTLLKYVADVNQANNIGLTPLHFAAKNGHVEAIKALLEKGADVKQANKYGWTPLHFAVQNGHVEAIKALLEKDADVVNKANEHGRTPLHFAADNGNAVAIKALLEKGADVNKANNNGWTPLYLAVENGNVEAIEALLGQGDVNQVNEHGWTPLHFAVQNGHVEAIKALLEKDADVNQADNNGWTPLHFAAHTDHVGAIEALLEKGNADVNKADNNGWTPLHFAAQNGHAVAIKALLEKDADVVNQANEHGCTPLHIAVENSHVEAIKALLEKGADVNKADKAYALSSRTTPSTEVTKPSTINPSRTQKRKREDQGGDGGAGR